MNIKFINVSILEVKLKVKKEMAAYCKNIKTGSIVNQFGFMTKIYKTGMFKLLMDRLYEINDLVSFHIFHKT